MRPFNYNRSALCLLAGVHDGRLDQTVVLAVVAALSGSFRTRSDLVLRRFVLGGLAGVGLHAVG